jgi:hypothetical protein
MSPPQTTLSHWRDRIFAGQIPIPVFNTTLVEDGRRLLVSPMTFATKKNDQILDSNTLLEQKDGRRLDLNVVTAARLSATFPYVSPSPRPSIKIDLNYHIIDGGYFDNSGVVTAIEWLDDNMNTLIDTLKVKRLVFIEIEAGESKKPPTKVKGNGGWLITLLGPLQALLSVRDASLLVRNRQEIELVIDSYRSKLDRDHLESDSNVQYLRIDFPHSSKSRHKPYSQPLSWKLTASQKFVLQEAWRDLAQAKNQENIKGTVPHLERVWKQWNPQQSST